MQNISKACEEFQEDLFNVGNKKHHDKQNSKHIIIILETLKTLWAVHGTYVHSVWELLKRELIKYSYIKMMEKEFKTF